MSQKELPPPLDRIAAALGVSTIAEVARALSIDHDTVRKWGVRRQAPLKWLQRVAELAPGGVSIDWLAGRSDTRYDWMRTPGVADQVRTQLEQLPRLVPAVMPMRIEQEVPAYGPAPSGASNDSPTLLAVSPREYALIANYRAAPDSEKALIEKTSAALAQRAPPAEAPPAPPAPPKARKRK